LGTTDVEHVQKQGHPEPKRKTGKRGSNFVQNAVHPMFSGLLVYRNYGLFGSVGIADSVVHSSSKMASLQKNSRRSIKGKSVKK